MIYDIQNTQDPETYLITYQKNKKKYTKEFKDPDFKSFFRKDIYEDIKFDYPLINLKQFLKLLEINNKNIFKIDSFLFSDIEENYFFKLRFYYNANFTNYTELNPKLERPQKFIKNYIFKQIFILKIKISKKIKTKVKKRLSELKNKKLDEIYKYYQKKMIKKNIDKLNYLILLCTLHKPCMKIIFC